MLNGSAKSLLLLLAAALATFLAPLDAAHASDDERFSLLTNQLASTQERLNALDKLVADNAEGMVTPLLDMMKSKEEPVLLRAAAGGHLSRIKDDRIDVGLWEIIRDANVDVTNRKSALYTLWKRNPVSAGPDLIQLAGNHRAPAQMRTAAISYLCRSEETLPPGFLNNIASEKRNPAAVRVAALAAMEEKGLAAQATALLNRIILDPAEKVGFKRSSMLIAERMFAAEAFEQLMFQVMSDQKNPLEARRNALDHLMARSDGTLLRQTEQVLLREKNPILISDFEQMMMKADPKAK